MYHPYYCEENTWHLCQSPQFNQWDCRVLFITNSNNCCALWNQKAAQSPLTPVLWDYHVVVLASPQKEKETWQVWDYDSVLKSPLPLLDYLQATFGLHSFCETIPESLQPQFRMLTADDYISHFSSDRSHMLSPDGTYLQPPPPWPPITNNGPSTLERFCDLKTPFIGKVLSLLELTQIQR